MVLPAPPSDAMVDCCAKQSEFYASITANFLRDAGIRPGMSVLDVGSGNGDLSVLLAKIVGPKGRVLGIDASPDAIAASRSRISATGIKNVEFIQEDAGLAAFPASFDGIVGRFILMHSRNPGALVANIKKCARDGGVVVFIEPDYSGARSSVPLRLCSEVLGLIRHALEVIGADTTMGLKLHRVFLEAGLPRPSLRLGAMIGGGPKFKGYEMAVDALSLLVPLAEKSGLVQPVDLALDTLEERMRTEVMESGGVVVFPPLVAASARLSASSQNDIHAEWSHI